MLSIVLAGRNNNYDGNGDDVIVAGLRYNCRALRAAGITPEVIFVEWNPVPDRPLLSKRICADIPEARCIMVDHAVHRGLSTNKHVDFLEFFAKNAGIREATADAILTTNGDVFLAADTLEFLAANFGPSSPSASDKAPDDHVVYRATRIDVKRHENPLAITTEFLETEDYQLLSHAALPPAFTNGSGSFILAHRSVYERCGGFDETIRSGRIHKDSRFCYAAYLRGARIERIGHVYHLDHPSSYIHVQADAQKTAHNGPELNYLAQLPYENPSSWGLASLSRIAEDRILRFEVPPNPIPGDDSQRNGRVPPSLAVMHGAVEQARIKLCFARDPVHLSSPGGLEQLAKEAETVELTDRELILFLGLDDGHDEAVELGPILRSQPSSYFSLLWALTVRCRPRNVLEIGGGASSLAVMAGCVLESHVVVTSGASGGFEAVSSSANPWTRKYILASGAVRQEPPKLAHVRRRRDNSFVRPEKPRSVIAQGWPELLKDVGGASDFVIVNERLTPAELGSLFEAVLAAPQPRTMVIDAAQIIEVETEQDSAMRFLRQLVRDNRKSLADSFFWTRPALPNLEGCVVSRPFALLRIV